MNPMVKHEYNNFSGISQVPYKIVSHLFGNEDIWKLIAYSTNDALSKPALTPAQKAALVWKGEDRQEDCRVYLTPMQENIQDTQTVLLRIYLVEIKPVNHIRSLLTYGVEVLCQTKLGMLEDGVPRLDLLWELIIGELAQVSVGGIGELFFDASKNARCRLTFNAENGKNYMGYGSMLSVHYSSVERQD